MNTEQHDLVTPAAVSPDAKLFKTPPLKVDHLRHIHDHGLAIQFADSKLAALIARGLAKQDGKATLRAGESHVTLMKLGNVTITEATFAADGLRGRDLAALHYYDPVHQLKYGFKKEESDAHGNAFATLKALVTVRKA